MLAPQRSRFDLPATNLSLHTHQSHRIYCTFRSVESQGVTTGCEVWEAAWRGDKKEVARTHLRRVCVSPDDDAPSWEDYALAILNIYTV